MVKKFVCFVGRYTRLGDTRGLVFRVAEVLRIYSGDREIYKGVHIRVSLRCLGDTQGREIREGLCLGLLRC